MIQCPNCFHSEFVGAFFCSDCGAQLLFPDGVPTGSIQNKSGAKIGTQQKQAGHDKTIGFTELDTDEHVALNIMDSGEIIPIKGLREVTLGRISAGQPIVPDIDLSSYHGHEAGISRLHASIQVRKQEIIVTDLGSANGTKINDIRIPSHLPHTINHGDLLTLGKLKIKILIRRQLEKDYGG